jgi:hypothetical protein
MQTPRICYLAIFPTLTTAAAERLRIATADDEGVAGVRLQAVCLTHDEDNVLTMTVRKPGGPTEPLTLVFPKRRSPVAQFVRQTTLEGGPSAKGPATPGLTQRDRLKAKLGRSTAGSAMRTMSRGRDPQPVR